MTDFDGEYQMAQINREICPGLETMLLPASAPYIRSKHPAARRMISRCPRVMGSKLPEQIAYHPACGGTDRE